MPQSTSPPKALQKASQIQTPLQLFDDGLVRTSITSTTSTTLTPSDRMAIIVKLSEELKLVRTEQGTEQGTMRTWAMGEIPTATETASAHTIQVRRTFKENMPG